MEHLKLDTQKHAVFEYYACVPFKIGMEIAMDPFIWNLELAKQIHHPIVETLDFLASFS